MMTVLKLDRAVPVFSAHAQEYLKVESRSSPRNLNKLGPKGEVHSFKIQLKDIYLQDYIGSLLFVLSISVSGLGALWETDYTPE